MLQILCKRVGRSEQYILDFNFDQELVDKIKELPYEDRLYDAGTKIWVVNAKGIALLIKKYKGRTDDIKFNFENDKQRKQFVNIIEKHKKRLLKEKIALEHLQENNERILEIKRNLPQLSKTIDYTKYLKNIIPMPHQLEGAYLFNSIVSGILALEMGLGKTLISLLSALMDEKAKQVLVICPANLKINWLREIESFTKSSGYIIKLNKGKLSNYRRNGGRKLEDCKFIITNYEYFAGQKFDENLKIKKLGIKPDILICDESHRLSNKNAQSTSNIKLCFGDSVKRKFLLTGTPVRNRLSGMFFALKMVKPEEFSNENKYLTEYCGLKYEPYQGWIPDETKEPKLKELNHKLQTFMYRLKKNVMSDLPGLYINKIYLEMSQKEYSEYQEIVDGFKKVDWNNPNLINTTEEDFDSPIVILSRLRQFTSRVKVNYIMELIEELNNLGEKVLVFDVFKRPLHQLKVLLGDNSEVYDGEVTNEKKQNLIDTFQDPNSYLKNLLISINAGSVGITLTQANRVFLISQDYLVSTNEQAFSRSHRKGQLRDVFGTIFILAETIDELIDQALTEKKRTINAVVDGEEYLDTAEVSVFNDIIEELRNMYKN